MLGLPEWIEDRAAWLLAGDWLELKQRRIKLFLQRRVERADRYYKP